MKTHFTLGAVCTAFAMTSSALQALDVLHIANSDSTDYKTFIEARYPGVNWIHKASGLTANETVGGNLDALRDYTGIHGGTQISARSYMEGFDLVIVGSDGVTSTNFVDLVSAGAKWAAVTKPVLFHSSLIARATGSRVGMFSGDNNSTITYANPNDTIRISNTALSDSIFTGVTTVTDLYGATSTETVAAAGNFGGGELITSLTDGVTLTPPRGIVFWNAGVTNGAGNILAAKRGFLPLRNSTVTSSSELTADGKLALGNLIDQLLVPSAVVFIPPSGLTAKSGIGQINLSWTASTGAVSYNIKRSTTAGSGYVTVSTPGAVTGTTYTDPSLVNGTTYYYVVSAVNAGATESANSGEASAVPVPVIQPAIDILYVANSDSASYRNFATNGQFANNTWTQKPTGTGTADNQVGGDLNRISNFTGLYGGTGITLRSYLESFDLIIIGIPTTSANFVDFENGAGWASITKPVIFNSYVSARATGGRPGLFSGDNARTITLTSPADTVRVSNTALSNALLAGVTSVTDLYSFTTADAIDGSATFGTGEHITSLTDSAAGYFGIVFWTGSDVPGEDKDLTGAGGTLSANRAFLPLKGSIDDLNADGKIVLGNLINQIQLPQVTPANPYGGWAATNISAIDPLALPGFNQDGDSDGIRNGLEWVLGGNPLASDTDTVLPISTGNATNGLTIVFNRATDPIGSTTLSVEWSNDLSSFPNVVPVGTSDSVVSGSNATVDVDAPSAGKVTVRIPAANAAGGKIFAHLKAQLNP